MTTEELRLFILSTCRPAGCVGLKPDGIAAQVRLGKHKPRVNEVKESLRWLIDKGFLERFVPDISPSDFRVRITSVGVDYLQIKEKEF